MSDDGVGRASRAGTTTSVANPPRPVLANTRWPTECVVTSLPTSATTPATSPPGTKGSGGFTW